MLHASGCRYVGFGDCHRCGEGSALGAFCEHFGADGYAAAESTFKIQHATVQHTVDNLHPTHSAFAPFRVRLRKQHFALRCCAVCCGALRCGAT